MGYRLAGESYGSSLPAAAAADEGESLVVVDGEAAWGPPPTPNPHKKVRLGEWDGQWQGSTAEWIQGTAGAGAGGAAIAAEAGHPGITALSTGTTTTGRCNFDSVNANIILFTAAEVFEWEELFRVPTLSSAAEQFVIRAGFRDANGADAVDGAYFELDSQADATLHCKTADNSVRTDVDSGMTVNAGDWVWIRVRVRDVGGTMTAEFDVLVVGVHTTYQRVATITTNIPVGAARLTGFGTQILKSVGTTARTVEVDWAHCDVTFEDER